MKAAVIITFINRRKMYVQSFADRADGTYTVELTNTSSLAASYTSVKEARQFIANIFNPFDRHFSTSLSAVAVKPKKHHAIFDDLR